MVVFGAEADTTTSIHSGDKPNALPLNEALVAYSLCPSSNTLYADKCNMSYPNAGKMLRNRYYGYVQ
ncbi:MAG: hypothetical protein ACRD8Z_04520 [Nitrososphaeraceae archaeon]